MVRAWSDDILPLHIFSDILKYISTFGENMKTGCCLFYGAFMHILHVVTVVSGSTIGFGNNNHVVRIVSEMIETSASSRDWMRLFS